VLAGELVKRQIEAKEKMLLQNGIRKAQQIEHDYLEGRRLSRGVRRKCEAVMVDLIILIIIAADTETRPLLTAPSMLSSMCPHPALYV
jgi:ketopantoate reductase